jgi:hypothetical protein
MADTSKAYTVILAFAADGQKRYGCDGEPSPSTMFMEVYAADSGQEAYERCVEDVVGDRTVVDAIVIPGEHDDVCVERRITSPTDPIKRVIEASHAKEARFVEEHGVSSAEFFGESGVSDAQDEAMRARAEEEADND